MREIKFRAWDLDNFNMWYSDKNEDSGEGPIIWRINNDGGVEFQEPKLIDRCPGGKYHEQSIEYRAPNQVFMEYTGLHDCEGNQIYEGDIIELFHCEKCNGLKAEVKKYWDGYYYFTEEETKGRMGELVPQYVASFGEGYKKLSKCKVIGNIHEEKNLLETENEE